MRIQFRTFLYALFFSSLMVIASPVQAGPTSSSDNSADFSASQIISEINAYRQANGSGALQYNGTLAGLAQNHSDFMASTGSITHDEGGTSPTDRAYAAGYGDGKKIILSEIIFGGTNTDVNAAITWWKNSEIHNRVMLDGRYVEIGAGVSTAGDMTYFTAEIAFITSSAAPSPADNSSGDQDNSGEEDTVLDFVYSPVFKATPQADGSLIHIVQSGQTLWTIAAVYAINLQTVLDLNNLTSGTWVFPGDEIIIYTPGGAPTSTIDPQAASPTATQGNVILGTPISSQGQPSQTPDLPPLSPTQFPTIAVPPEPIFEDPSTRWMILIAFLIIFGVVVGSIFFQKPNKRPPPDDLLSGQIE